MALNGCLSNNTSGESGHWTMASSDAANHDDDLTEQDLLEEQVMGIMGIVYQVLPRLLVEGNSITQWRGRGHCHVVILCGGFITVVQ